MTKLESPKGIVIHHSLTKDGQVPDWDAIKRYHVKEKGWSDIGYHFGIERVNGKVMTLTGRSTEFEGAHTVGHNDMIGICVVGNYDTEIMDGEKFQSLLNLVVNLLNMYPHLTPDDIHKHHDFATKSCPGCRFPWGKFFTSVHSKWSTNKVKV